MKKVLLIVILTVFVLQPLKAKEIQFRQSWIELTKKVRTYKNYSLKKRSGYLEPGNYRTVSNTNRYYQLDDSTFVKTSDNIKEFKILYKPESFVTVEDTIAEHRAKVDKMLKETSTLTPSNYIFAGMILILLLYSLIKN